VTSDQQDGKGGGGQKQDVPALRGVGQTEGGGVAEEGQEEGEEEVKEQEREDQV
jgi:hypothetical protein